MRILNLFCICLSYYGLTVQPVASSCVAGCCATRPRPPPVTSLSVAVVGNTRAIVTKRGGGSGGGWVNMMLAMTTAAMSKQLLWFRQKPMVPLIVGIYIFGKTVVVNQQVLMVAPNDKGNDDNIVDDKSTKVLSTGMISSIGFYKNFISPLLPPACRFVPTCSRYGVLAIEEFGPAKGAILIAWRLLRCSPIGGKGYDPPKWPPVPYTYSSY